MILKNKTKQQKKKRNVYLVSTDALKRSPRNGIGVTAKALFTD